MSNIFNTPSERKPNTWVAWFILGMCLSIALENPIYIILGVIISVAHKMRLQENRE